MSEVVQCGRKGCVKPVRLPGQKYCSKNCAPFASLGAKRITSEPEMDLSTTKAAGDPLVQSWHEEKQREFDTKQGIMTLISESDTRNRSESIMAEIKRSSTNDSETDGTPNLPSGGTSKTESESNSESSTRNEQRNVAPVNRSLTPLLDYIAISPSSEEGNSQPKNLIDDALLHLQGLMKSVAADAPERRPKPEMVNAVCNVAKNMRDLMKLKLEIYQAARDE